MSATTVPHLLMPPEVAAITGMTTARIIRMARAREIPHLEMPDGSILIDAADLARWLDTRRRPIEQQTGADDE